MADIVELLEEFRYSISRNMHVALPGKIEKYDYKTQKANIKIDLQELYRNGDTLDCPVIGGVPIMFPASGGAFFTMPVKRGDTCWIMFADRDITRWLFDGRGLPCESVRSHNLNDAVAVMGVHPFIDQFKLENNDDVVISYSGSRITIKPDGVLNITTTKDVNINAAKTLNVETGDNTNIKAKGSVNVTSEKEINLNAFENVNVTSKQEVNVTATEDINITTDKVLNIKAAEDINVSSANITIENEENITINTKNSTINVTETATVNANDVIIKATGNIDATAVDFNITGNLNVSEKLNVKKGIKNEGGGIVNIATGAEILPSINLGEGITNHGLLPTDGFTNNKGIVNSGGISNVLNVTLGQVTSFEEGGITNHVGSIKNSGALGIINELGGIKSNGLFFNNGEMQNTLIIKALDFRVEGTLVTLRTHIHPVFEVVTGEPRL